MKSKQFILFGIVVLTIFMFSSCWYLGTSISGNGHVTKEVRKLSDFDALKISRGMNVYITYGSPAKVVVVADNNLHKVIITEVNDNVLKVYADANILEATEKKVMITVDNLTAIKTSSGANVFTTGPFTVRDIKLLASSGSNITMEFNARFLEAKCSAGANIILLGQSKASELEASSGANLKAEGLKSERCKMNASSGSFVHATVLNQLEAKASSGGNIVYYGDPSNINTDTSSGGNIHRQ